VGRAGLYGSIPNLKVHGKKALNMIITNWNAND